MPNGELFAIPELQSLTMDLINNLRNCKTKLDQFEVITNLACKFLSYSKYYYMECKRHKKQKYWVFWVPFKE